jgi:arylsulfatase A-like enzyme
MVIAEAFRPSARGAARGGEAGAADVRRKAVRTRREKFVWQSDEANALYDVAADPGERRNLAAGEPERADRLRRRLFDWLAESQRWALERGLSLEPTGRRVVRERRGAAE